MRPVRWFVLLFVSLLMVVASAPTAQANTGLKLFPTPTASSRPTGIAAGPDGNLWFTETGANAIGRITPAGVITEFPIPTANSSPWAITAGPDGNLWFTMPLGPGRGLGQITTSGVVTEFSCCHQPPLAISAGPDGNLWFTESGYLRRGMGGHSAGWIGRMTTTGVITEFPIPTVGSTPIGITAGPDGNLCFTEYKG